MKREQNPRKTHSDRTKLKLYNSPDRKQEKLEQEESTCRVYHRQRILSPGSPWHIQGETHSRRSEEKGPWELGRAGWWLTVTDRRGVQRVGNRERAEPGGLGPGRERWGEEEGVRQQGGGW